MRAIKHIKKKFRKQREMKFTKKDAEMIAKALKIDFNQEKFDLDQFYMGLNVELEHGLQNKKTNVTNNDPILTGKIALAHLYEFPDYYTRLKLLEDEAKEYWQGQGNETLKDI